ncbi:hypothetical protein C9374_003767 [Naegleria lovaniensis]|uniref:Transmembrane protein 222 n=1 Tax=Naegleria lovaniensis TaxID=51637 RepID=A0AA88H3S7_NAELO|nr:uncharacterized protein C9374_003767 [Naegleria lovaniensis]KAG2394003.1 hypothetical protein C9374_003767 [Naegleria lovaniensis]
MATPHHHSSSPVMTLSEEEIADIPEPTTTTSHTTQSLFNPSLDRYPYCIVWTPIPLITWLLPFIGHMGIATSQGVIHDFAGPYYISVDDFAFGKPTRYLALESNLNSEQLSRFDSVIKNGAKCYRSKMYNFFCQNCHHYTVHCLNDLKFRRNRNIGIVEIAFLMFIYGKYVNGPVGFLKTWLPFFIVFGLILFIFLKLTRLF